MIWVPSAPEAIGRRLPDEGTYRRRAPLLHEIVGPENGSRTAPAHFFFFAGDPELIAVSIGVSRATSNLMWGRPLMVVASLDFGACSFTLTLVPGVSSCNVAV